jgi:hypothetical protein
MDERVRQQGGTSRRRLSLGYQGRDGLLSRDKHPSQRCKELPEQVELVLRQTLKRRMLLRDQPRKNRQTWVLVQGDSLVPTAGVGETWQGNINIGASSAKYSAETTVSRPTHSIPCSCLVDPKVTIAKGGTAETWLSERPSLGADLIHRVGLIRRDPDCLGVGISISEVGFAEPTEGGIVGMKRSYLGSATASVARWASLQCDGHRVKNAQDRNPEICLVFGRKYFWERTGR